MHLRIYTLKNLIIHCFSSRQKKQEYYWRTIHNWAFRFFLSIGRRASSLPTGRQAFSVSKSKENKAIGIIADIHINQLYRIKDGAVTKLSDFLNLKFRRKLKPTPELPDSSFGI
jgi:hypothetical protein